MPRNSDAAKKGILTAATKVFLTKGADKTTIAAVATSAECAKGLVNYHFKSKDALLAATIRSVAEERVRTWQEAFEDPDPNAVIDRTWALLLAEQTSGLSSALASSYSCPGVQTEQAVNEIGNRFAGVLGEAADGILAAIDRTVKFPELGELLAAVVTGIGLQLAAGGDVDRLENAYAAAWLGVLGLSRPRRRQRRRRR